MNTYCKTNIQILCKEKNISEDKLQKNLNLSDARYEALNDAMEYMIAAKLVAKYFKISVRTLLYRDLRLPEDCRFFEEVEDTNNFIKSLCEETKLLRGNNWEKMNREELNEYTTKNTIKIIGFFYREKKYEVVGCAYSIEQIEDFEDINNLLGKNIEVQFYLNIFGHRKKIYLSKNIDLMFEILANKNIFNKDWEFIGLEFQSPKYKSRRNYEISFEPLYNSLEKFSKEQIKKNEKFIDKKFQEYFYSLLHKGNLLILTKDEFEILIEFGLSEKEVYYLDFLANQPYSSIKNIAESFGYKYRTVQNSLLKLTKAGFISKNNNKRYECLFFDWVHKEIELKKQIILEETKKEIENEEMEQGIVNECKRVDFDIKNPYLANKRVAFDYEKFIREAEFILNYTEDEEELETYEIFEYAEFRNIYILAKKIYKYEMKEKPNVEYIDRKISLNDLKKLIKNESDLSYIIWLICNMNKGNIFEGVCHLYELIVNLELMLCGMKLEKYRKKLKELKLIFGKNEQVSNYIRKIDYEIEMSCAEKPILKEVGTDISNVVVDYEKIKKIGGFGYNKFKDIFDDESIYNNSIMYVFPAVQKLCFEKGLDLHKITFGRDLIKRAELFSDIDDILVYGIKRYVVDRNYYCYFSKNSLFENEEEYLQLSDSNFVSYILKTMELFMKEKSNYPQKGYYKYDKFNVSSKKYEESYKLNDEFNILFDLVKSKKVKECIYNAMEEWLNNSKYVVPDMLKRYEWFEYNF